jgi:hypothetical protein
VVSRRNSVSIVTNGCDAIRVQAAASADVVVIGCIETEAVESNIIGKEQCRSGATGVARPECN